MLGLGTFLVDAKRRTYAAQGDDASMVPQLAGSKQLEYGAGPFHYRDVYFGLTSFAGLETVSRDGAAIWAMSYAGGIDPGVTERQEVLAIYALLRKALAQVSEDRPFRGPSRYEGGGLEYLDNSEGELASFRGRERIVRGANQIYRLDYAGGLIRWGTR
jgi:hypothetical protein